MTVLQAQTLQESPPLRRPTEEEINQARELRLRLCPRTAEGVADPAPSIHVAIHERDGAEGEMELPPLARTMLEYILSEMAAGNGIMLTPVHPLLTPFEAADLLGVSLSYLTELMDKGKLPHRGSGANRRIVFEELMTYKKDTYEARSKVLDELVAEAQELGMGY